MTETFRLSRSLKYLGMGSTAFFIAMIVYCGILLKKPAELGFEENNSAAIGSIIVYGALFLISIYIWSTYHIERLIISGTSIAFRSVFQKLEFDASDLQAVHWKIAPGRIVFDALGSKVKLDLGGYTDKDRLRIIRKIHEFVPSAAEKGWPLFCHKVALPLRDGIPSLVRTEPSTTLVRVTRRRYDRILLISLPIALALSTAVRIIFHRGEGFLLSILIIVFWLPLHFSVPPEGASQVSMKFNRPSRDELISSFVVSTLLGTCIALMFGLQLFGIKQWIAWTIESVPGIAAFLVVLYAAHKIDNRRRLADEQATERALCEWEQGEIAVPLADHS